MTITIYIRSLQVPETNCHMSRVTAGPATSLGGNLQRHAVARQPDSTYRGPQLQITHPPTLNHTDIYHSRPIVTHLKVT